MNDAKFEAATAPMQDIKVFWDGKLRRWQKSYQRPITQKTNAVQSLATLRTIRPKTLPSSSWSSSGITERHSITYHKNSLFILYSSVQSIQSQIWHWTCQVQFTFSTLHKKHSFTIPIKKGTCNTFTSIVEHSNVKYN
jgi:hypothetical protein